MDLVFFLSLKDLLFKKQNQTKPKSPALFFGLKEADDCFTSDGLMFYLQMWPLAGKHIMMIFRNLCNTWCSLCLNVHIWPKRNSGPRPIIKIPWCKARGLHIMPTHPRKSNYNTVSLSSWLLWLWLSFACKMRNIYITTNLSQIIWDYYSTTTN